jgi:hypothetical protein
VYVGALNKLVEKLLNSGKLSHDGAERSGAKADT